MYATLKRSWEPLGRVWTPNMLLGSAIGDALSEHYRGHPTPVPEDTLRRVILEGFRDNDTWTREALVKLAQKGYEAGRGDNLRDHGEVLMVDEPLPSTARPDLVQRIPGQGLVVTDTKVTMRAGEDKLTEYFTSHQLFHYAWEVGEVLREPVSWARVHMIQLAPRVQTFLHPVEVTPARLTFWLKGAEQAWFDMDKTFDEDEPWCRDSTPNFTACYGKYGPCEYIPACHVLHLDPDQMESAYGRLERKV